MIDFLKDFTLRLTTEDMKRLRGMMAAIALSGFPRFISEENRRLARVVCRQAHRAWVRAELTIGSTSGTVEPVPPIPMLTPKQQAKRLLTMALRYDIHANVFNSVAEDLRGLEQQIFLGYLRHCNDLPVATATAITYETWRARAITVLLSPEEK